MSASVLPLPALDGRDPLGFLAALGTVRLLARVRHDAQLSWNRRTAVAELHGVESVDALVAALAEAAASTELSPGLPSAWLPKMAQKGGDRARIGREEFRPRLDEVAEWCAALWTDVAVEERKADSGDGVRLACVCTPFYAPMGKQSMRQMFERATQEVAAAPETRLREALTGWRRVDGYTGESLDIRALEEAAESATGSSNPAGVPGATWLALAALPFFRMTGDQVEARVVGWSNTIPGRRSRRRGGPVRLIWALWSPPLDVDAIAVLLDHPDVRRSGELGTPVPRALGVFDVRRAERRLTTAAKSDGILVGVGRGSSHGHVASRRSSTARSSADGQ